MSARCSLTSGFAYIGQTGWPASPNPNAAWINGPQGAILSDTAMTTYVWADSATGEVTIAAGGKTWTFNSTGLTMSTGIVVENHIHLVAATPGDSGGPLQGPGAP